MTGRIEAVLLAAAAIAWSVLAAAVVACITTPPPDLPAIPLHRPTILHESVVPPANELLVQWPLEWDVPVQVEDPSQQLAYAVFEDYDPIAINPSGPVNPVSVTTSNLDGGVVVVSFQLAPPDPGPQLCHRIEFLVARTFNTKISPRTPDSLGGDSVDWRYSASGAPNDCLALGVPQDGAAADASTDALLVAPGEGGGEP